MRRRRRRNPRRNRRTRPRLRQTHTSLRHIDRHQPNPQRQRGHHLEVHQRLDAHAPHTLDVAVPRNPHHQRSQDQRRHNRLDQPQKNIRKYPQVHRKPRRIEANLRPCHHRHKYPGRQTLPLPRKHREDHHSRPPQAPTRANQERAMTHLRTDHVQQDTDRQHRESKCGNNPILPCNSHRCPFQRLQVFVSSEPKDISPRPTPSQNATTSCCRNAQLSINQP